MQGAILKVMGAGAMACAFSACSGQDLASLQELPVRTTPQAQTPHTQADPDAPLRGTAVAVDVEAL